MRNRLIPASEAPSFTYTGGGANQAQRPDLASRLHAHPPVSRALRRLHHWRAPRQVHPQRHRRVPLRGRTARSQRQRAETPGLPPVQHCQQSTQPHSSTSLLPPPPPRLCRGRLRRPPRTPQAPEQRSPLRMPPHCLVAALHREPRSSVPFSLSGRPPQRRGLGFRCSMQRQCTSCSRSTGWD